jgi:penicillin G amidase
MSTPPSPLGASPSNLLGRALGPVLRSILRRSLPTLAGEIEVPDPVGGVEVLRDRFGVPQIFAETEHDLFFAQGFVHAQDRFFQMELQRRAGHGRLAELLGGRALEFDRLSRAVGFGRIARQSVSGTGAPEALAHLEAYSAGVNACLDAEPGPPELTLLRRRPEPWTPADTAAWSLVMAWSLSASWESKMPRPTAGVAGAQADPGASGAGSNAWAVAPERSASGSALLAGDPHLALGIPCLWYEVGLYGGRYGVVGASLPGTPGVVIGHNERIAWSVTAALTDVQDLYVERFSKENPTLYEHRGEWLHAGKREEKIPVRGRRKPVTMKVRTTLHGPVITDVVGEGSEGDLALRWAVPEPLGLVEAGLAVNRARGKEEFLDALRGWQAPNQNFVYADRSGTIGWALAGPVPARRGGHRGDRPVRGWTGEREWEGFLPFEELPREFGLESGLVASANEAPPDAERIPGAYLPGYRKARIEELLRATPRHALETFRDIQADLHCAPAHALARRLAKPGASPNIPEGLLGELATWDGRLDAASRPGAVARVALEVLLGRAAGTRARPSSPVPSGVEATLANLVPETIARLDDLPEAALHSALEEAAGILAEACGPDPARWSWGALHQAELRHPLGVVAGLRGLLNRGPYPAGGDANTVRLAAFGSGDEGGPRFGPVTTGPNYRFVVDTGDWDRAWSIVSPGQSGHPASEGYDDQVDLWLRVRYRPMVFGRRAAGLAAKHALVLRGPGKNG